MIQGEYNWQMLQDLVVANGGQDVNLTMLTGENTTLGYDADRNKMTFARALERFLAQHLGGRAELAKVPTAANQ